MSSGPVALHVDGATASGDDGNKPENALDGNLDTRWSAEGDGQWIKFDLGAVHHLTGVRIAFHKGDSRVARFDLEVSADDVAYAGVLDGPRSDGRTTALETFDFPAAAVPARYVRYVGHGNDDNAWNSLTEVEVWGTEDGPTQTHPTQIPPIEIHPLGVAPHVVTYPAPPSLHKSPVFRVFAGSPEQEVFTEQFTKNRTIHLAGFSAAGPVPIRIDVAEKPAGVQISPTSRSLAHTIENRSIRFTITGPEKLVVFVRTAGGELDPLYLYADPLEESPPAPGTVTHFFAPGAHDVGDLELKTGETLYIAGGALVTGRITAERASGVTIRGRGILRETPEGEGHTVRMDDCSDVLVEGVTIRDTEEGWSSRYVSCHGVTIRNVKIFSCGIREDGVDPDGSTDLTIDGCLISTGDDCIAIKSLNHGNVSGITIQNTVLDSYPGGGGGDGVKIGTETDCDEMHDILVKNCDVVRAFGENSVGGHSAFSIVHKGRATIRGVRYEDIHVEGRIQHKDFEIIVLGDGSVSDVRLRDIAWAAAKPINLIGGGIHGVAFENCTVAGAPLTSAQVHREDGPAGVTFS